MPDLADRLAGLHALRGIYLLTIAGARPHLGWSVNLLRRLSRFLVPSYPASGRAKSAFSERIVNACCWPTGSRLETSLMLYELTKQNFPDDYRKVLRLRMPWFVSLRNSDSFAVLDVANRIAKDEKAVYGPFRTRDAAETYQQHAEGLFQVRRCRETLEPHPEHPGCIYGEMNQCMRPCQCAVSVDEYAHEAQRVSEFLSSNGRSPLAALTAARDRASDQMEFEQAGQMQKRIERLETASKVRDEAVRAVAEFNGVALTRASERQEFRLWPMIGGIWQDSIALNFSSDRPGAHSLDAEIRTLIAGVRETAIDSGNKLEHLAIFSRWYYSSWRDGSWFPFRAPADLNYRRLVRELSKMFEEERRSRATEEQAC
jgi:hypothetical protein